MKSIIIILCAYTLTACMFAPGMDMKKSGWKRHGPDVVAVVGIEDSVEIIPITQKLIGAQKVVDFDVLPAELLSDLSADADEYKIGKNDVLSIVVWGQPELVASGDSDGGPLTARQVRDDGTIVFPFAGTVKVLGLTRELARQRLITELEKFFKDPQVDVAIAEYNSQKVILSGQFNQQLTIPLTAAGLTLGEAVTLAQGPTALGDVAQLSLLRANGQEYVLNFSQSASNRAAVQRIRLKDKDIIQLPLIQSYKIYVVGDVGRAQVMNASRGTLTLTDALAGAGGVSPITGSGNEVYVLRAASVQNSLPTVFSLNANSPTAYLLSSQFKLLPQDVVFVGPAELTKWNRVLSQLFPSTSLLRAVDDLSDD